MKNKARVIAFYLPQYHPIPENDETWGKGFTEWTNVAQARPLFKGHYQPCIPADLGFYDLRMPEIREAQAKLAKDAGIEGFMYWHYWFGNGRMLLEKPFQEVLKSGKPDFPFCLGWANHSWQTKTWTKGKSLQKNSMIMEQLYPGKQDIVDHFNYCLPAFKDQRYITVDGKPLFVVFAPADMPNVKEFIGIWRDLAERNGLKGIHFVGLRAGQLTMQDVLDMGFDAVNNRGMYDAEVACEHSKLLHKIHMILRGYDLVLQKYPYKKIVKNMKIEDDYNDKSYPTILPNYDRTARAGRHAIIYYGSTPELFKEHVVETIERIKDKDDEHKIVFLKSWNEWGEGNYMEPDLKFGHGYLEALKEALKK